MLSAVPSPIAPRYEPLLEEAYQADLAEEKLRVLRITTLLCVLLYATFGLLDLVAVPSDPRAAWLVRAIVILPTLGLRGWAGRRPATFNRHYSLITCATYAWWGLGIEAIILVCEPSDLGWSTYYAGLILVSMALYAWTYLRPLHACVVGVLLACTYIACAVLDQRMAQGDGWIVLVGNCFFLISANIIGLMSLHTRERFSRQAFLLKNALRRDLQLEEEAKRQSEYLAQHDPLTGLPNRLYFTHRLQELLATRAGSDTVAVLFLDLDGFKPVNDEHGHAAGDAVLRCVAERMRRVLRAGDLVARLGGDEFVVALSLSQPYGRLAIDRLSGDLRQAIALPVDWGSRHLGVTVSIGAAVYPEGGRSAEALIETADAKMVEAKRRRRPAMA